jgi:heme transport system substrate-binding protein
MLTRHRTRRYVAAIVAIFLSSLAIGTARAQEPGPQRVVVVGGVLTEIVYALGQQDRVVGIDTTSVFPTDALEEKPNVGYMRALSAEGVLALDPDLILIIEGAGPAEVLDVLRSASVPVVTVPEGYTPEAIAEKVRIVAEVFGVEEQGEVLARSITEDIAEVTAAITGIESPRRVMFVLSFAGGRLLAAGENTAADAIIRLAGGVNALAGFQGYAPVSDEAVTAAGPQTILAMQNAGPDPVTADAVFALPALVGTPAAEQQSFVSFDGQFLLAFGPRTADAIRALATALYPDLDLPKAE